MCKKFCQLLYSFISKVNKVFTLHLVDLGENETLPNSLCHFRKYKSVFIQILHQYSVTSNITPLYFFSSNIIYFGQKKPIKGQTFEIFEYSGQN